VRRRSIAAFPLFPLLVFGPFPACFLYVDPPAVLPFPWIVVAVAVVIGAGFARRWWRRTLAPTAIGEIKERRCCVTGRLRRLDRELVSPWTKRPCVAWLGFFCFSGDGDDEPLGLSVPFALEPHDGGQVIVIHLANGRDKKERAWDHLAYGETRLGSRERAGVDHDTATAFLLPAHVTYARSGKRLSTPKSLDLNATRALCEVVYAEGDDVVIEGRFRRVADTMGVRSGDGLPTYQVVTEVTFAKGPIEVHRRWLSPWFRANVTFFVMGGIVVELVVHGSAYLLVHGINW
jgi:hypothetical protein